MIFDNTLTEQQMVENFIKEGGEGKGFIFKSYYDEENNKIILSNLYYDKNKDISKLEIKIHEGKNRQVRKMCKAINHPVLRLKRVAMGKITLNDCKVGEYRHLTEAEVNYLKSI